MNRKVSMLLVIALLLSCVAAGIPQIHASAKSEANRAIAIVFDNSGSMYEKSGKAWCRATYAMEVFASMLNAGDVLQIYPMHPIVINGMEYTMENPFQITDVSQASAIREIFTPDAGGTPIESIDYALQGLKQLQADQKYMIVLTDGGTFSKNGSGLSKDRTRKELDSRVQENAGRAMTVMYLGIGSDACMPETKESEYFVKRQAHNSADVLSTLTEMCNKIFGRDSLPKSHISGKQMEFDISMKKLIIFVQGEDIANLSIKSNSGGSVGRKVAVQQTKYSTAGAGDYKSVPDTSLQGMMVTYEGCDAGSYTIEYTGTANSVEVYYEPDADLDFVFTDAQGNVVNPDELYEGEYVVSFGMKDAKTGKLISSDLLGNPEYEVSYYINGQKFFIDHSGQNGEIPVSLKMDDRFNAELTVTYLGGYTISKGPSDFGWPADGLLVTARPAGDLRLEITGGDESYSLQHLEEGAPFIAKVYYKGELLTGDKLASVDLRWEPELSNAEVKKEFAEDHYKLRLFYKDPDAPQDTVCGSCTVTIYAYYTEAATQQAKGQTSLTYHIKDDYSPLQLELQIPEAYLVIKELDGSKPIVVKLMLHGRALTPEEFEAVKLQVDCGGIEYTLTPSVADSSYLIQLHSSEGLEDGDYTISVAAQHTDLIGRMTEAKAEASITLSTVPLWLKWVVGILIFLVLLAIILIILHIKVLPKQAYVNKRNCSASFDGEDVSKNTSFSVKLEKGHLVVNAKYAGVKTGVAMDVKPGDESYLKNSQARRYAEVKSASVRKNGSGTIQDVSVANIRYSLNEDTNKLERKPLSDKPFNFKHGAQVNFTAIINSAGVPKPFTVNTKVTFKKK